jgi:hypothetical protein
MWRGASGECCRRDESFEDRTHMIGENIDTAPMIKSTAATLKEEDECRRILFPQFTPWMWQARY